MVNKLKGVRAKLRNKKGFTLIELLVVVAIIGILVLLALPRFIGYTKDADVATMKADIRVLESAALIHNVEDKGWPTADVAVEGTAIAIAEAADSTATVVVKAIDEAKLKDQIQSLKNEVSEYGIITNGAYAGQVVHLKGQADREGKTHYGLDKAFVVTATEGVVTP